MNSEYIAKCREDGARARLTRSLVAYAFGVEEHELDASTRRGAKIAFARQVAMYLTHIAYELSLSRVAAAFGRDRTTVAHACHLIEDCRDERAFDERLDELEAVLRTTPPPQIGKTAA